MLDHEPYFLAVYPVVIKAFIGSVLGQDLRLNRGILVHRHPKADVVILFTNRVAGSPEIKLQRLALVAIGGTRWLTWLESFDYVKKINEDG